MIVELPTRSKSTQQNKIYEQIAHPVSGIRHQPKKQSPALPQQIPGIKANLAACDTASSATVATVAASCSLRFPGFTHGITYGFTDNCIFHAPCDPSVNPKTIEDAIKIDCFFGQMAVPALFLSTWPCMIFVKGPSKPTDNKAAM